VDLKKRISDSDFIKGAYSTLSPLIDHYVKIKVRRWPKRELRTFGGKLIRDLLTIHIEFKRTLNIRILMTLFTAKFIIIN